MATVAHVLAEPIVRNPVRTLIVDPARAVRAAVAIARGRWYRLKFRILGIRFAAGRNLRVEGRLRVVGPGEVCVGEDVMFFDDCQLVTHAPHARLTIGNRVQMRSTHIDCAREVSIGDWSRFGMAYVADTDSHSTHVDRYRAEAPVRVAPVRIEENVWVAQFACVLPGAVISRNSVVSCGSVCARAYPPNSLLVGNPARVAGTVPGADGAECAASSRTS